MQPILPNKIFFFATKFWFSFFFLASRHFCDWWIIQQRKTHRPNSRQESLIKCICDWKQVFFFLLNFLNIFSFYEFVYITQLIVYKFFSDMEELLADHQVHRAVNTPVELLDLQLLVPQDVINEIFLLFLPISSRIQDRKMKFLRLLQQKSKFNAAI